MGETGQNRILGGGENPKRKIKKRAKQNGMKGDVINGGNRGRPKQEGGKKLWGGVARNYESGQTSGREKDSNEGREKDTCENPSMVRKVVIRV